MSTHDERLALYRDELAQDGTVAEDRLRAKLKSGAAKGENASAMETALEEYDRRNKREDAKRANFKSTVSLCIAGIAAVIALVALFR